MELIDAIYGTSNLRPIHEGLRILRDSNLRRCSDVTAITDQLDLLRQDNFELRVYLVTLIHLLLDKKVVGEDEMSALVETVTATMAPVGKSLTSPLAVVVDETVETSEETPTSVELDDLAKVVNNIQQEVNMPPKQ